MHPILFRIPLPHSPLKAWWGLAAVVAIGVVYALLSLRRKQRDGALVGLAAAAVAGGLAYYWRGVTFEAQNLPIYSYGVMLGLSLVVGWYLTLGLADREGLPKETMANCYVFTAIAAIIGSRLLYIVTNLDEFKTFSDIFALRRGGLVAYGGFIGGYLGSWFYLSRHKLRVMPWADVAVPSLASGLFITRIGCYLFGCDFGKRLPDTAPGFLKKLGTFPHWPDGTLEGSNGSPAYERHLELFRGTPLGSEVLRTNQSLPVHPTQIYESLLGLGLLGLLLWQRKSQRFRGQIFFTFAFAYGVGRFLLEIIRDDPERGEYGPTMPEHLLVPLCLLIFAVAFTFGMSLGITNLRARTIARVVSFLPTLVAYVLLKPASFGASVNAQLSTSQIIAVLSAVLVSYFYARYWEEARRSPKMAMAIKTMGEEEEVEEDLRERRAAADDDDEDEEATGGDPASDPTLGASPAGKKKKRLKPKRKRAAAAAAATSKGEGASASSSAEGDAETDDDGDEEPAGDPAPGT